MRVTCPKCAAAVVIEVTDAAAGQVRYTEIDVSQMHRDCHYQPLAADACPELSAVIVERARLPKQIRLA